MLEWLQNANGLERVANSFMLICLGLAALFGLRRGEKRAVEPAAEQVEVAGALIDARKADEVIAALNDNTEAKRRLSEAVHMLNDDIREIGRDVRDLTRKLKD